MIPVAFEAPLCMLYSNHHVQDYSFGLAQYVLEDQDYRTAMLTIGCHTLDNGFHELGHPLSVPELIEAVKIVKPKVVVAPDWLDDAPRTLEAVKEMRIALKRIPEPIKVMGVVQGTNLDEVHRTWDAMRGRCDVLGLPFKKDRLTWWHHCEGLVVRAPFMHYHLLGVNELDEFAKFRAMVTFRTLEAQGRIRTDTGKPYKWAICGESIVGKKKLRASGISALDLLNAELSTEQRELAFYNVAHIRKVLA